MSLVKRKIKIAAVVILSVAITAALIFGILVAYVYKDINYEADELMFEQSKSLNSTTFFADQSTDAGNYEPIAIEISGNMRKIFYSSSEIGDYLRDGFVAVEDKKFYSHPGFDIKRTALAAVNLVLKRERMFGASTITQQVVKNISGDNQISLKRKLAEIIRAIHIEKSYSKEEILEVYLNIIPMSENIYGVGAASRAYFGKDPRELLPEEAATLIGITNAPTAYNPYINPDACKRKRDIILSIMHKEGIIDEAEYERAKDTPLSVIPREQRENRVDSWFVETVIDDVSFDLAEKYGISTSAARMMLLGGGYSVYTTMKPEIQQKLEEYFSNKDIFPSEVEDGLDFSMAVTDSCSGYLVGIVGRVGDKVGNRLLNHATVPHIPGSVLKPIALYAPLIDSGKINWATVFDDVPIEFIDTDGDKREYPRNSPGVYDGLITVSDAIRKSKNTVAVRLCKMLTPKAVYNSLKNDFGFDTLVESDGGMTDIALAPMALGQLGVGVSLRKITESYSVFAGEGEWREAVSYLYVNDKDGRTILENKQEQKRIFKATTAKIMNQLLMTVTDNGTAASITLKNSIDTAGKTGTSGGSRDRWFIGYTPYYTAGIWCGYDNGKGIGAISPSHLKIWDEIMTDIHAQVIKDENKRQFSTDGLSYLPYCMDSGREYSDVCLFDPRGNRCNYGYFADNNRPHGECDRHILCRYDCLTKAVACPTCPEENVIYVSLLNITDRSFPKEIQVTDAEFVYRDIDRYTQRPIDYSLPYFQYSLPEGIYVGRSKGKKQFNSNCYLHGE